MPEVELLIGPIASGKTTYSKKRAEQGWVVVNDDSIVQAVHGGDYTLYSESLKPLYKSTENHILATALAMGKNVVVDRGLNCAADARRRLIGIAGSFDARCVAVWFDNEGPEVHARRRAEGDGRGYGYEYWLRVAEAHEDRFCSPSRSEGLRDIRTVSWGSIQNGSAFK